MAWRFCSTLHAAFLFQPGQLILQLPDLLEEAIPFLLEAPLIFAFAAVEHLGAARSTGVSSTPESDWDGRRTHWPIR
jgi:hypothetical protein